MIELLAVPAWNAVATPLSAWVEQFENQGLSVAVERESTGVSWLEIASLRLRGYALTGGGGVEAINFELAAPDPEPARLALVRAASALTWEVHEDDNDDDDDSGES